MVMVERLKAPPLDIPAQHRVDNLSSDPLGNLNPLEHDLIGQYERSLFDLAQGKQTREQISDFLDEHPEIDDLLQRQVAGKTLGEMLRERVQRDVEHPAERPNKITSKRITR